jgi:hypothetical protein
MYPISLQGGVTMPAVKLYPVLYINNSISHAEVVKLRDRYYNMVEPTCIMRRSGLRCAHPKNLTDSCMWQYCPILTKGGN